jgi:dihydroorotate dehydrogenase (NAD+) catalytic subunit
MEVDLSVEVIGLRLVHPFMNASGILGWLPEHVFTLKTYDVSAIVTKTFTPEPRAGHREPLIIELPSGAIINSMGLPNPGITGLKRFMDIAKKSGLPVIVSIGGRDSNEFREIAIKAEEMGANAIELNLSCPHTKEYGLELGADPLTAYEITKEVASSVKVPVIAKLGLADKIIEISGKVLEAGAKALTLINTIRAMSIDVYSARPILSNIYGGLSGSPIHPIAVRVIYDVYQEYRDVDILASGGAINWYDAAEFILAGAKAIQLGTALMLKGEKAVPELLKGLRNWLTELNVKSIEKVVGLATQR